MRASAIISLSMWYRTLLALTAGVLLLATPGCAKYPSGGATGTGPQLVVTMTLAGPINPNYYYFVIFDVSNDTNTTNGPVPVIAPPWGNGFCATQFAPSSKNPGATSFVEYTGSNPANGYLLENFTNSALTQYQAAGVPVQSTAPAGGSANTLQFTVLFSQLATASIPADKIQYIQINAITTDVIPTDPNATNVTKDFDALGDPNNGQLNDYITIPTAQAQQYSQNDPTGDVELCNNSGGYTPNNIPALDITRLTVQVVN